MVPSTLMSQGTFDKFAALQDELVKDYPRSSSGEIAGVFVPCAGQCLKDEGGIYYIGMGTHGPYKTDNDQTLAGCAEFAHTLCTGQIASDFWQFLDGLTLAVWGSRCGEITERWGWSNLFKIGWSRGNPSKGWPAPLLDRQRELCTNALYEELRNLRVRPGTS